MPSTEARAPRLQARHLPVIIAAIALGWLVIANSIVAAVGKTRPDRAALVWADHPTVLSAELAAELAAMGRSSAPLSREGERTISQLRILDPLSPASFRAISVAAAGAGDTTRALRASGIALTRDPGDAISLAIDSVNAVQVGRGQRAIDNYVALAQMYPNLIRNQAPVLAALVDDPANRAPMIDALRRSPVMADAILSHFAKDAANAAKVLSLAPRAGPASLHDPDALWPRLLIQSLVASGQAARARALWLAQRQLTQGAQPLLFDPGFREPRAGDVFGWQLTTNADGLADARTEGGLSLTAYGHEDVVLAAQTLALPPGSYRLAVPLRSASGDGGFRWTVDCLGASPSQRLSLDLDLSRPGVQAKSFAVPAGCPSQLLRLRAIAPDIPAQANAVIGPLSLARGRP